MAEEINAKLKAENALLLQKLTKGIRDLRTVISDQQRRPPLQSTGSKTVTDKSARSKLFQKTTQATTSTPKVTKAPLSTSELEAEGNIRTPAKTRKSPRRPKSILVTPDVRQLSTKYKVGKLYYII